MHSSLSLPDPDLVGFLTGFLAGIVVFLAAVVLALLDLAAAGFAAVFLAADFTGLLFVGAALVDLLAGVDFLFDLDVAINGVEWVRRFA